MHAAVAGTGLRERIGGVVLLGLETAGESGSLRCVVPAAMGDFAERGA
ncbi:hypothetical protein [Naasia aerilata]|uniref:Uncharacterized protein n=1 Tax=Naasia aerilata TaxID=1162966 RepID=A0ABM8GEN9_9MICO|nr:hypothetical protein [Naasia aerilata]BDZ46773.1 hypothetical protein GCM10025866_26820 [Naasia aerilata]